MTEAEYYDKVRVLGLRRHRGHATIFMDPDNHPHCVPPGNEQTPEQRIETIARLQAIMGVGRPIDG